MINEFQVKEHGGGVLVGRLRVVTKVVKENKVTIVIVAIAVVIIVAFNW